MRYTHNLWGPNEWGQFPSHKVKGQGHTGHVKLLLCPLRGFLLIWPNHFICGIHAPYKGVKCRAPFSGRMLNVQSHMACFKFWPCPLCGPVLILLTHFICCMKGQWSRSYRLFEIFTLSITWLPFYLIKSHCIRHTYNTWGGDVSCTIFVICPLCGSMPDCPLAAERCRSYYIPRITSSVYNREIAFVHCFVAMSIIGDRPYRLWKFCPILTSSYITEFYSGRHHIKFWYIEWYWESAFCHEFSLTKCELWWNWNLLPESDRWFVTIISDTSPALDSRMRDRYSVFTYSREALIRSRLQHNIVYIIAATKQNINELKPTKDTTHLCFRCDLWSIGQKLYLVITAPHYILHMSNKYMWNVSAGRVAESIHSVEFIFRHVSLSASL